MPIHRSPLFPWLLELFVLKRSYIRSGPPRLASGLVTAKACATNIIPYYPLILMATPVYNEIQELRNELQVQTMVTLDLETRPRIAQGAYISHLQPLTDLSYLQP